MIIVSNYSRFALFAFAILVISACDSVDLAINDSLPAAPSNLEASVSAASVSLSWDAVSAADSYKVYRDGALLSSVSTESFSQSNLDDGTYLYEVASVNEYGESADRASISVSVSASAPEAPTDLRASLSGSSVVLSWSTVSNASGYEVYRDGNLLASIDTHSFSQNNLADGTYLYEVASINDYGVSADKASISVNISVDQSPPAAPSDLTASVSASSVNLNWSAVDEASSYRVYRDDSLLVTVSSNSFSESELADGLYTYEVAAVNEYGESADKASVSVSVSTPPPTAPANITSWVIGANVSLSWSTVADATSYKVYRDDSLLETVSANSFSESNLADGTYLYEVSAVNDYGESESRASISVSISAGESPPATPTNLRASVSGSNVSLSWNVVNDASSYRIYRDGSLLETVNTNSFTDSDLADATYLYEVSAINAYGESAGKSSVSATVNNSTPAAPTNFSATVNADTVNLSWDTVANATSYNIYRDSSLLGSTTSNTFTDTTLADGTYFYEVSAVDDIGESTSKASVSATVNNVPPAAPTNLSASVNQDSVNLSWDTVADATSYNVYRDSSLIASPTTNAFTDTALVNDTYLYEVSAVDDAGESTSRASVSATVNNVPPSAPTNLSASANGSNVNLSWDTVADATSYNVYRDSSLIASPTTNAFTDTALADGTYFYEVSAVDDAGESTSKASVSATVNNEPPTAPTNLTATVNGSNVNLNWNEVSDATSYNVYRDSSLIASPTTNAFTDTTLADGTYLYEVSAVDDAGESTSKASVNATVNNEPPTAPTNLSASVNQDTVNLSWDEVSDATSYNVYRDSSLIASPTTNAFTDTALADGTYLYEVSAVDDAGESTSKASVSATVNNEPPTAPTNLSASANGSNVNLSWNTVNDATSYNVYRDSSLLESTTANAFTDTALADGTYLYEVSAVDDAGESTSKASVSATVNNAAPAAPTNLSASANGSNVNLSWDEVSDATSYNVYRDSNLIASPTTNAFTDTALADGTYLYEVSAVDDAGESTSKASVSATVNNEPPAAPTNLTASANGSNVNLTWNTVDDATSYKVYRDSSLIASPTSNAFTDTALADGTYLYEVSAVDDAGESTSKASVSATVNNEPPTAPTNLSASVNADSVNLTWDTVADATSYNVYRDSSLIASPTTTTFTDTALADGTYLYEVSAVDGAGESTSKASVSATVNNEPPSAPTNLSAAANGSNVNLNWDTVADATSYKVYRDSSLIASPTTNAFTDTALADGTYSYEVSSVDDAGESTSKASVSATVNNVPPAAPTNLSAAANGSNVNLNWDTVADATSYNVYRDSSLIASPTTNAFTDTALADGTYSYEVSSVDDAGESTSKASVSATVNNEPPAAPTNLSASVNTDSVNLTWDTVADATSYNVYRDSSLIASPSTNAFTDTALADGTYLYEVSAVDDAGESTSKASVNATVNNEPPSAPTNLSASANGSNVNLSWDEVSDATSYNVYRDSSLIASPTTNAFTDTALADGTYLYEVSAVDDAGESTSKASVSATVNNEPPAAPTNLTAAANGSNVNLTWNTVTDATSYNVYRDSSLIASPTTTTFTDTALADGTYLYEVSAVDDAGESTSKASITVSVIIEPMYAYQWFLENTGQDAFATLGGVIGEDINHSGALVLGITGEGVRVNVIDTGLEIQHPDLQANIVAGGSYNYLDGSSDPTNTTSSAGDHGTSAAGIIAAVGNNGIGVSGVAGAAQLQGYNFLSVDGATYSDYILAHGGDEDNLGDTAIFNKSLGSAPTSDSRIYSGFLDALSCFTTGGVADMSSQTAADSCQSALRSGLGALYVKSAGNNFTADDDQICDSVGITCWNVNMESEETYPYQIIVGALNAKGEKSSYSTAGPAIWISAPGGEYGWDHEYWDSELDPYGYKYETSNPESRLWQPAMVTVDQVGCDRGYTTGRYDFNIDGVPPIGYTSFHEDDVLNPNCEYTSTFNGTSSAAPVASGVVALMLEANPDLSWRDVKHILASSARQIDSSASALELENVVCSDDSCSSTVLSDSLSFVARDAWITNAAGYQYHTWYGFGAINAGAAVAMAQTYSSTLGTWQKKSYQQSPALAIPDSTGASAIVDFSVADALTVEAVQLDLDIAHACIFELGVVVHSPSGTRSVILTPYNQFNCDQDFSSTLLTNAFYGESAVGDWQVEIYDIWETTAGTLNSVSLNIYGH